MAVNTWYSLGKNSALFFERCRVNKIISNELAGVGRSACASYLKHIITARISECSAQYEDRITKALCEDNLNELFTLIECAMGHTIEAARQDVILNAFCFPELDVVGQEEYTINSKDINNISRAIDACKELVDFMAPISAGNINEILKAAEGNVDTSGKNESDFKSYYKIATKQFEQATKFRSEQNSAMGALNTYIDSAMNYLLSIVEESSGWSDNKKAKDIEMIKEEIKGGYKDLGKIIRTVGYRLVGFDVNEYLQLFKPLVEIYNVTHSGDNSMLAIRDTWIDAVKHCAELAKDLAEKQLGKVNNSAVIEDFHKGQYEKANESRKEADNLSLKTSRIPAIGKYGESCVRYLMQIIRLASDYDMSERQQILTTIESNLNYSCIYMEQLLDDVNKVTQIDLVGDKHRKTLTAAADMYTMFAGTITEPTDRVLLTVIDGVDAAKELCDTYIKLIKERV